jgi:peptidoglycan/xylan/chitin deacetylase (PgdA/CDA1 family)
MGHRMKERPVVAILGYHNVGDSPVRGWDSWFYVPEPIFVEQLECLRAYGWAVIDLDTFLNGLATPHVLPRRAALITFDDGCRQFLDVAFPWLRRFKLPAVYFVATGFIGGTNRFDRGELPTERMFTWTDLRHIERANVAVESHSVLHRKFSTLTPGQQQWEIARSKAVLETRLGKRIRVFSFPYGNYGGDRRAIATCLKEAGYQAACLYSSRGRQVVQAPVRARYFLSRLPMGPDTDLAEALAS